MHVVATAGHVDHGKSTLVRALTGMEPDRWAEERRRGMTIDLGFAWTDLPSGETVAFVDVPGHQRFIGNMLAGVGPVPAALFVVAADEGWARQSAEHLAALDALGVRHGLLAVTRADLADPDIAAEEALEHLAGSSLGQVEAVTVSGVTGEGLDELRQALDRLVAGLPKPRADDPKLRLWVDRAFSIRGSGTVVTGTLGAGTLHVGDELEVLTGRRRVRVRGLQSLKQPCATVAAVARVAVNLRGVDVAEVSRGDALVRPQLWRPTDLVDARLSHADDRLPAALVLHVGSAAVSVTVRPLGAGHARLRLATPLPLEFGDRGILRDPGGQHVAAGLTVLDPAPPDLRRRGAAARRAGELMGIAARSDPVAEIRRRGLVNSRLLVAIGVLTPGEKAPAGAVAVADWLVDPARWDALRDQLLTAVDEHAAAHALAPGLPRESALRRLDLPDAALLDALVAATPGLVADADGVHRADVRRTFPPAVQRALDELTARLRADPFAAPEAPELARLQLTERHLAAAVKAGVLAKIADGVFLLPSALDDAVQRLLGIGRPFTLSTARQALGTTRRVAVPLLEALDAAGRTRRIDHTTRELVR